MTTFFSADAYRHGRVASTLARAYLLVTGFLLGGATLEGTGDGAFMVGFALLATLPLSLGVMLGYSAIETAHGVPVAQQDGSGWVLVAFAVCALVNAFGVWVVVRGRRVRS